jgi:hypothetical protein
LLAVAASVTLHVVESIALQRRAADRQHNAQRLVANTMEQLCMRSWDRLRLGPIEDLTLDAESRAQFNHGRWVASISPFPTEDTESPLRRVRLEFRWRERPGAPESSALLSSWVARAGRRPR